MMLRELAYLAIQSLVVTSFCYPSTIRWQKKLFLYVDNDNAIPTASLPTRKTATTSTDYVRWKPTNTNDNRRSITSLESAICTLVKPNAPTIQLHAMVHMGDAEYYDYWNNNFTWDDSDFIVLYELLIDESLLSTTSKMSRQVRSGVSIQAPPGEQQRAQQLGWVCQADCIEYSNDKRKSNQHWYHADFTVQELQLAQQDNSTLFSFQNNNFLTEAWTALTWGPPQLMGTGRRRVFTNLWLDGDTWVRLLRVPLWITVPCPELFQLVLDTAVQWSILTPTSSSLQFGTEETSPLQWLPPLHAIRQWMWGQVLVTGHQVTPTTFDDATTPCMQQRNERALQVVDHWSSSTNKRDIALLYGCHHCPDLERRMLARGYTMAHKEYRTVWSLPSPSSASLLDSPWVTSGLLTAYAALSALDWVVLWDTIDSAELVLLYLVRHTALYVTLSQVLLNIQKRTERW